MSALRHFTLTRAQLDTCPKRSLLPLHWRPSGVCYCKEEPMTNREYDTLTLAQMQTRDYVTLDRLRNGYVTIPKGTKVRITGKRSGLTIQTLPCDCCGMQVSVARVPPHRVEALL